jgi:hypothetical protein
MSICCPSCKSTNEDSAKFCSSCGSRLVKHKERMPSGSSVTSSMGWRPSGGGGKEEGVDSEERKDLLKGEQRRGSIKIAGCVREVHKADDTKGSQEVWTFRLERYDRAGNRRTPVPVQVHSKKFELTINEGDEVEVKGRWHRDGYLKASKIYNRTSKSKFKFNFNLQWVPGFLGHALLLPWYLIYAFFYVAGAALILYLIYAVIKSIGG